MKFQEWKKLFDKDELSTFTTNKEGLLWLKLKAISRKDLLISFILENNFQTEIKSRKIGDIFIELFEKLKIDVLKSNKIIDNFILKIVNLDRNKINEELIVNELYKMKSFNWGGDYSNALDKYLVDRYVKVYSRYNDIVRSFENGIYQAVEGYVLCSWYNHWSSILIEDIFKEHKNVIPAIGRVKKVDFFINQIPFDLKVTYLPENYVEKKRKESNLSSEISTLKSIARKLNISFDKDLKNTELFYQLSEKIRDKNDNLGIKELNNIKDFRKELVDNLIKDPKDLILNLYEEQGELRFDASNRLFIILVDKNNFEDSWKLKRNIDLLRPSIKKYLDKLNNKKLEDLKVNFKYKNKGDFEAYADVIFIIK